MIAPHPTKGLPYILAKFFVNHVNFCEDYYDGTEKPANPLFDFCRKHWLFPFEQNDCVCCNTVRGLLYGGIAGYLLGRFL